MAQPTYEGKLKVFTLTNISLLLLGFIAVIPIQAGEAKPYQYFITDQAYVVQQHSDKHLDSLEAQLKSIRNQQNASPQMRPSLGESDAHTPRNTREEIPHQEQQTDAQLAQLMQDLEQIDAVAIDLSLDSVLGHAAVVEGDEEDTLNGEEALEGDAPLINDAESIEAGEDVEVAPTDVDVVEDVELDEPDMLEPPLEEPQPPPTPREIAPTPATLEANREMVERLRELQRAEGQALSELDADIEQLLTVTERRPYVGDPMQQPVSIDFRDMELSNVVALLAHKAGINIIAGIDLRGTVTANLREVPLQQAMETALRMNGLGLMEEDGIYHIVSYQEAQAAKRITIMVHLEEARAADVQSVLNDVSATLTDRANISITANQHANLLIISGPERSINDLVELAKSLDVTEAPPPTVTEIIFVNHAEPEELATIVENLMLSSVGEITADGRGRQLVIKDIPVIVEQVRKFIQDIDIAVKQVNIEAMVLDVVLDDEATTGVDWMLNVLRRQDPNAPERFVGNLQELTFGTDLDAGRTAGIMNFGLLTRRLDWRGIIQAELQSSNAHLVSNPSVITLDGKPASITIAQEIPYIELTQTDAGGTQTSTQFKDIGTILEVTPQVTHDNQIIADIVGKESNMAGVFNNIPIEEIREIETTARVYSGQTIFMGGLRKNNDTTTVRKVPFLGDLPVVNALFRQNIRDESAVELLIFLTCSIVEDDVILTDYQQSRMDLGSRARMRVNAGETVYRDIVDPEQSGDPTRSIRRNIAD